jgi:hypothetical protein
MMPGFNIPFARRLAEIPEKQTFAEAAKAELRP